MERNPYITGAVIKELRGKYHLTQAALSSDKVQMLKLYPEGNAEGRFKMNGVKRIVSYCNRDGLFFINVVKGNCK